MKIERLERERPGLHQVKDQLKRHVYERTEQACASGRERRGRIGSAQELLDRQRFIREQFLASIGGLPESADGPPPARTTGIVRADGYRIEKLVLSPRPGVWATALLYVPEAGRGTSERSGPGPGPDDEGEGRPGSREPGPAVLFLCGHHDDAKHTPEYQMVCQHLVRAGLIVLALDPPGQGERLQYVDDCGAPVVGIGVYEHDYAGVGCWPLGDSLARYFVHDAMRAIDYMCARSEIDPLRIGVTGNSGGGTQTSMLMMAEPRIAAAAPATFITSRLSYLHADQAQDAEQIWPGFTKAGLDHEDILLAMAPRPVLVLAVESDFFPIEGTRETVHHARRGWELLGVSSSLELQTDEALHRYTPRLARAAAAFFARHLKAAATIAAEETPIVIRPAAELWCCAGGQVLTDAALPQPQLPLYAEIAERAGRLQRRLREQRDESARRAEALGWLQERLYEGRMPTDLNPRLRMLDDRVDELLVYNAMWWSQPGVFNHALIFRRDRLRDAELPLTIALWEGGTQRLRPHWEWIRRECGAGRSVMVVDLSGMGPLAPHPSRSDDPLDLFDIVHKLADDLIWLGDSLAALRAYDLIRSVEMAARLPLIDRRGGAVYACGRYSLYAELAAAGVRVRERETGFPPLRLEQPLSSVTERVQAVYYESRDSHSLVLPGMLRYFDLPDLRRWREEDGTIEAGRA